MAFVQTALTDDNDELELDLEQPLEPSRSQQQEGYEGTDVQLTSLYSHDLHSSDEHDPLHAPTQPAGTQLEGVKGMQPARSPRGALSQSRGLGSTRDENDTLESGRSSGQKPPDRTGLSNMRCKLALGLALLLVLWIPVIYVWTRRASGSGFASNGSVLVTGTPNPREPTPPNTLIAYVGDVGLELTTSRVYELIAAEGAQAIVIQGDLDYKDAPDKYSRMLSTHFNDSVAVFPVAGNHDVQSTAWPAYSQAIADRWVRSAVNGSCHGLAGESHTCSFKGVLIVQVSPAIFDSRTDASAAAESYLRAQFSKYAGSTRWLVGSWHKNQREMQTGHKASETGWGVYEACREAGALIATGHEHSYARTFLLSDFAAQRMADLEWNATASWLPLSPGNSVAFCNGLGGRSARGNERCSDETPCPWFANLQNSHADGSRGLVVSGAVLFCNYNHEGNPLRTRCYLKSINAPDILDEFIMDATHMPLTTI